MFAIEIQAANSINDLDHIYLCIISNAILLNFS